MLCCASGPAAPTASVPKVPEFPLCLDSGCGYSSGPCIFTGNSLFGDSHLDSQKAFFFTSLASDVPSTWNTLLTSKLSPVPGSLLGVPSWPGVLLSPHS
jgi:hypothetical protein